MYRPWKVEVVHGYWDPMRLEQVLNNLLTNAIRYGNYPPLIVKLMKLGDRVRLSVKDQGIDLAQEAQTRIFDQFERAIDANEISGLGLGLFISQQIIEGHRGKIWVESTPNEGAVFIFEIPLTFESES